MTDHPNRGVVKMAMIIALLVLFAAAISGPIVSTIGLLSTQHTWMTLFLSAKYPWPLVAGVGTVGGALGNVGLYLFAERISRTRAWQNFVAKPKHQCLIAWVDRRIFSGMIIVLSTPVPDQVIMIAGLRRYPIRKFIVASFVGRGVQNLFWSLIGAYYLKQFLYFMDTYQELWPIILRTILTLPFWL